MRVILCWTLLLSGCAAHGVRCDGRLQPVNVAVAGTAAEAAAEAPPRRPLP